MAASARAGTIADMAQDKPSQVYMRFLHLVEAVRRMPAMPLLDAVEERLLNVLVEAWQTGQALPVTEAVRRVHGVSERTVFRRLKSLQDKGLLCSVADTQDARVHHLKPSRRAEEYFDRMGRCIEQLQSSAAPASRGRR